MNKDVKVETLCSSEQWCNDTTIGLLLLLITISNSRRIHSLLSQSDMSTVQ